MLCYFVFAEDGQIFSWGRADYGQLGVGDDVVQQGFCSEPKQVLLVSGAKQVESSFSSLKQSLHL